MAQKIIQGSETLGRQIKSRRNELELTIEEAAARANVGQRHGAGMRQANRFAGIRGKGSAEP